MFSNLKTYIQIKYQEAKAWFKYSETILWSRIQMVIGFITGVFTSIDWSNLQVLDWSSITKSQGFWVGFGLVANGIITECLRRRNSDL